MAPVLCAVHHRKIKKPDVRNELVPSLTEKPDVLKAIAAAKTRRHDRDRLQGGDGRGDCADPDSGFGSDTDRVTFVSADGVEALPLLAKTEIARRLVSKLAERLAR